MSFFLLFSIKYFREGWWKNWKKGIQLAGKKLEYSNFQRKNQSYSVNRMLYLHSLPSAVLRFELISFTLKRSLQLSNTYSLWPTTEHSLSNKTGCLHIFWCESNFHESYIGALYWTFFLCPTKTSTHGASACVRYIHIVSQCFGSFCFSRCNSE